MKRTDNYNAQIEALMKNDFTKFAVLIGHPEEKFLNHYHCWNSTGTLRKSIFANLPGCNCCATQVDHGQFKHVGTKKFGKDRMVLPNMSNLVRWTGFTFNNENENFRFSRAQLREIARRQRMVRTAA